MLLSYFSFHLKHHTDVKLERPSMDECLKMYVSCYAFRNVPNVRMTFLLCTLKFPECANDFPHESHVKGLTHVCVILCDLRCSECANDFPHVSQVKCLTPVCILLFTLGYLKHANDFPHVSHVPFYAS